MDTLNRTKGQLLTSSQTSSLAVLELTPQGAINQIARIKKSFPTLPEGFYEILMEQVRQLEMTDAEFEKATTEVIRTSQYPTPTVAQFLQVIFYSPTSYRLREYEIKARKENGK